MSDNYLPEESARAIYEKIWSDFARDRKANRTTAYANLQHALAEHAADLVPAYFTAKEHLTVVADVEQWAKNDKPSNVNPVEAVANWLAGKGPDLSRISMIREEKVQ